MIPNRLRIEGIRFVLLEKGGKKPFEREWQKKEINWDNEQLQNHLKQKGNYGVMGGGKKKLLIVDFDDEKVQEDVIKKLPKTFTVKTGSGLLHKYFFSDKCDSFKIFNEDMETLADIQGEGKQVVGPGSVHPNGNNYEIVDNEEIANINYSEIKAIMMAYDKKPKKEVKVKVNSTQQKLHKEYEDDFLDDLKSNVNVEMVLSWIGIDTSINPCCCPFHSSKGGKCLGFNEDTAHCFHCDNSWNIFSLVMDYKKCDFKESLEYLAEIGGMESELEESKERYKKWYYDKMNVEEKNIKNEFLELISGKEKKWAKATEILVDYVKDKLSLYTTISDTRSEMWVYREGVYEPEGKSEIKSLLRNLLGDWYSLFVFNKVVEKIEPDTFIDSVKFFSQNHKEEIVVNNGILNVRSLELRPFSKDKIFFNKIPVDYIPGQTCEKIDQFLKDVLANEEDIKVFYELVGFCLYKEYTFEKAFMFHGNGRNGKGKSLELIKRLLGMPNVCSIPLISLIPESFSVSELFGKMVNLAGDIGNQDLKDTSMFKSLTGRDVVGGKRKFLKDISFENYAKFVFACNELPMVYDLSRGFWDRWILLDFPYTFVTEDEYNSSDDKSNLKVKDDEIISKISSAEEMSGLLNMALLSLNNLFNNKKFSKSKGTQEIKSTWIRRSNSFIAFCHDFIEEDYEGKIRKKDMRKYYSSYCKNHSIQSKSDYVIKRILQEQFGASEERIFELGSTNDWYWTGIKFKGDLQGLSRTSIEK